jgi:uncharacterized membrane protein
MATSFDQYIKEMTNRQGAKNLWPNTGNINRLLSEKPQNVNVSELERRASIIGGTALAMFGVVKGGLSGLVLAGVGGDLIYRGATGHCVLYEKLGVNTSGPHGIKVERVGTIDRPVEELYRFWRNFENLPRFMEHLESVKVLDNKRSHWVAKAPAGGSVEWDAEIVEERENELISWRSLPGADVPNTGRVTFTKAPGNRGYEVRVNLEYSPPAGQLGAAFAKLFGEEPDQQVMEDLRHFKEIMEVGEIPTTKGQPSCRNSK